MSTHDPRAANFNQVQVHNILFPLCLFCGKKNVASANEQFQKHSFGPLVFLQEKHLAFSHRAMATENVGGSDGEMSLPPSVREEGSQASGGGSPASVSLPASVCEDGVSAETACCKRGNCPKKFSEEELEQDKLELGKFSGFDRSQKIYQRVLEVFAAGGKNPKQPFPWQMFGKSVCRKFWEKAHGISPNSLDKYVAFAKAGHAVLPDHAPKLGRATPRGDTVDTWFIGLYQHLAEPLAIPGSEDAVIGPELTEDAKGEVKVQHEVTVDAGHALLAVSINANTTQSQGQGDVKVPLRYLNFESDAELYQFYQTDEELSLQVSKSTFFRVWQSWKKFLPFKNRGQQSKCQICAELSYARTDAVDKTRKLELDAQKKAHLDVCMADRRVNVRGNRMASRAEVFEKAHNDGLFMKVQLDGMDQAKFSLPRLKRLVGTSMLSKIWRPNIHVVGCVVFGMVECYYLMPPDCPKNASMNCTVLSKVLDVVAGLLRKMGIAYGFPPSLVINVDNTPRESKNSHFGSFLGMLVAKRVFQNIQVEYMQVDHTHNELDQRFSTMAATIKAADHLEDMDDLCHWLTNHMKATSDRSLHIEVLQNTHNFRDWLGAFDLHAQGLTSTHLEPFANHVWRFTTRLLCAENDDDIEVHHKGWDNLPPHPEDVVLTVKQYMSSGGLSQKPQLLLVMILRSSFFLTSLL